METKKLLENVINGESASRALMYRWHNTFRGGRTCTQAKHRSGRPSVVDEMVAIIKNPLDTDQRMTVKDFANMLNIGAHNILKERFI